MRRRGRRRVHRSEQRTGTISICWILTVRCATMGPRRLTQHSGGRWACGPTPSCAPASASCRKTAPSMPPSTLISSLALTFSVTAPDTRRGWTSTTRGWSWQKPTRRRRQTTTSVASLRSRSYLLQTKFCCFICFFVICFCLVFVNKNINYC